MIITIQNTRENATLLVKEALDTLKKSGDKENILRFEKGIYNFYAKGAYEGYFTVSNNYSGNKRVVFPILQFSSLTIDGGGSTFLFHNRLFPVIMQHSQNICLKNFVVDFSFPRFCLAKVAEEDQDGFTLYMDKEKFPHWTNDSGNLIFQTGEAELSSRDRIMFMQSCTHAMGVCFLVAGQISYEIGRRPAKVLHTDVKEGERGLRFTYAKESPRQNFKLGDVVMLNIDENRENDCIFADQSENILVENVRIHRSAGMGFIAQLCKDVRLQGLEIRVPEGREELYSTTADGVMFCNCEGEARLSDCYVSDTIDDPLNSHGAYACVQEVKARKGLIVFKHLEQGGSYPLFREGDEVFVCDCDCNDKGGSVVRSVRAEGDLFWLELEDDLLAVGDYIENRTRMPELTIENCEFVRGPHLRISGCGKITVRGNRFTAVDFPIHISDELDFWYESGRTTKVLIEDNEFYGAYIPLWIGANKGKCDFPIHGDIILRNNVYGEDNRAELVVKNVKNFLFESNRCLFTDDIAKEILVKSCDSVLIDGKPLK